MIEVSKGKKTKYAPLTVDDIAPYMGKIKKQGKELVGECPVCHKTGHLYASTGKDGKLIVFCQHCNAPGEDVIKALIAMGAKGQEITEEEEPKVIEIRNHYYNLPNGELSYQKVGKKYSNGKKEFRYVWQADENSPVQYTKPEGSINLYNLDKLAEASSDEILYIVEGEKCADSMIRHGFLATTGHCGAKIKIEMTATVAEQLDRFPIKVVIPDNDAKGADYVEAWPNAYILPITDFWAKAPNKGDVADYFAQGGDPLAIHRLESRYVKPLKITAENITELGDYNALTAPNVLEAVWRVQTDAFERERLLGQLEEQAKRLRCLPQFKKAWKAFLQEKAKSAVVRVGNKSKVALQPLEVFTGEWTVNDSGITRMIKDNMGTLTKKTVCVTPMIPTEQLVNIEDGTYKIRVGYKNGGKWQYVTLPQSTLAQHTKIVQPLSDIGVAVDSNTAKDVVSYFTDVLGLNKDVIETKRSVSHLGWTDDGFIPYADGVTLDTGRDMDTLVNSITEKGTLDEWVEFVRPLRENLSMRLMIAAAFASPLISRCDCLPYIVHLFGMSGYGKTVALMVAASVWGNPAPGRLVRSMNMTINNMATVAATLYSVPFFGDELQTIKQRVNNYDSLIMRITEGIDRGRNKDGKTSDVLRTWQNGFIFTGEEPITTFNSGGGAKNRVLELECNEKLVADGNGTASFVRSHYGCAGREFIQQLPPKAELLKAYQTWFTDALRRGNTTDKQAMVIALMCLADQLASEIIFKDGESDPMLFYQFCKRLDEVDVTERAWDVTTSWVAENIGKFQIIGDRDLDMPKQVYGRKDEETLIINKIILVKMLQENGFSFEAVKKSWAQKGYLLKSSQDKMAELTTVAGIKSWFVRLKI